MKIAVACQNKKTISGHAGKVSNFFFYTIEEGSGEVLNRELITLEKKDILHIRFHKSENPWAPHPLFEVDLVITGGAGPGFVNRLATQATKVVITSEGDPNRAVKLFMEGSLPQLSPAHHHYH